MSEQVNSFASEKKVTNWFVDLIKNNKLYDILHNKEVTRVNKPNSSPSHIPSFSFDRLSRVANLNAADNVLDSLNNLEIISIDNSVSLKTGEILRPDIICFNPEKRIFVIFEIKRDNLTERQALTELYAYEQEVRNIFPFMGNREIQTVIVSKDWDTLLEHAVSNYNSWSNKHCLAISIDQISDDDFKASVKISNDWYFRGVHGLPEECFQTFDLFVDGEFEDSEYVPDKISTFVNIIVKQCDRSDIHGFIMVWKNYSAENYGNWGITFCSIDPLAIFNFCKQNTINFRESNLTKYADKFYKENLSIVSSSLEKIVSNHLHILKEDYKVSLSNYMNWSLKLNTIKFYAKPIYYDFYGIVSDYVINFVSNTVVRKAYLPFLNHHSIDWHHPLVAPLLINNLNNSTPYPDGVIRCKDSFTLGSRLGIYKYLVERYLSSPNENLKTSVTWAYSDILTYLVENQQLSMMFSTIQEAPPLLSNIDKYRLETLEDYCEWVVSHLLKDEQGIHTEIFGIGFNTAVVMSKYFRPDVVKFFLNAHSNLQNIAEMLRNILKRTIQYLYENNLLARIESREIYLFNRIKFSKKNTLQENVSIINNLENQEIIDIFITDEFESFDKIYPSVFHTSSLEWSFPIDIDDAKKNIKQLFADKKYPAISINPNGKIGIVLLDTSENEYIKLLFENINIDIEIILVSNNAAANIHSKMTWVELKKKFEGN